MLSATLKNRRLLLHRKSKHHPSTPLLLLQMAGWWCACFVSVLALSTAYTLLMST